jgi:hypothetical protein
MSQAENQAERAAVSSAIDDRDRRLRLVLEPLEKGCEAPRVGLVPLGRRGAGRAHLADVGARAEHAAGAGQRDDAHRAVAGEFRERRGEPGDELAGERIARLGPVERQRGEAAGIARDREHRHHIRNTP